MVSLFFFFFKKTTTTTTTIVDLPWPIRLEGNSKRISCTEFIESAGAQNKDIIAASQTFY